MPILAVVTFELSSSWFFWGALLAFVTGILILIFPRILNYIVAIYLIIAGLLGLIPYIQAAMRG
jgi:uncharacterized membrane protein